jgi:hypothetical protein
MAEPTLEQRVAALEREVAALKAAAPTPVAGKPDWLSAVLGKFKGNADYADAAQAGQELRATGRLPDEPPPGPTP